MQKMKIGVFMGGPSFEYDVSISTGEQIIKNLNKEKYSVIPVKISKKGDCMVNGKKQGMEEVLKRINFAFLALHGEFGEDGQIQKILDKFGVPYNGSGAKSSALAMDKYKSRKFFESVKIPTPKLIASLNRFKNLKISEFPIIVKPRNRGSSIGVSIVYSQNNLDKALKKAFRFDNQVLVESYIQGIEVSCGVIENFNGKKTFALPVTQIMPVKDKFFSYKSKYTKAATKEITPAPINENIYKKIQDLAVRAHKILECRGYSRADFIVADKIYILEVNTLPGMTKTSLLPQQTKAVNLDFPKLLDKIISCGFSVYLQDGNQTVAS